MLPKLGLVSIGVHDDVLNWVAKYKPVSIILVNERGLSSPETPWTHYEMDSIRQAMSASPKTLWIVRSWPDGMGEGEVHLATRLERCFEPFMDMPNPKMAHSYNEPGFPWIGTKEGMLRLAALEGHFAKVVRAFGLLSMNFCFSESHLLKDNLHLWAHAIPVLRYVDALGFNEYDWRSVLTSRDQGYKWRIGHWEHQLLEIRKYTDKVPPVIIGEGVLDGKIWTNALPEGDPMRGRPYGWQKVMAPNKYVREHQAAHDDTYHKPGVFSHHTFCLCHESSEWRSYSVKPILGQLGQLVQNQVYWNDKEDGPMGVWKNVPENIAQWKPLIEKVTSSYHVPIPDYKGVHVSPAKVLACIMMRESGGDPDIMNSVTGAAGLMQIMPFHFESGQDPYGPEWNIRTGLSILENKIHKSSDLLTALFWYSGRADRPEAPFIRGYWEPFVAWYKQFWGVDLEPRSNDRIQEALQEIAKAKSKIEGIDYLKKQALESLDAAEEGLLGLCLP